MRGKVLLPILIIILLTGCASPFVVQVSAIADPQSTTGGTRYVLLNGNAEGQENDLFFREFSAYFVPILAQKGYQRVDDRKDADIEIFFRYGVSDGRTGVNTFTHPIYETIGGNTFNITQTKTDSGGTTTTTHSTVHIPLQTLYIGTAMESQSYTLYTSSAALEAYKIDLNNKITSQNESDQPKILWKTLISSTGDANDLRTTMPAMASAAGPVTRRDGRRRGTLSGGQ